MRLKFYSGIARQLERGNQFAAGYDIRTSEDVQLHKHEPPTIIYTDLFLELPAGYVGIIKERSGLGKKGCAIRGGVIDEDYRGEVCVLMTYMGLDPGIQFKKGDRVAQLLVIPVTIVTVEQVSSIEALKPSDRGSKGFGSTGMT